MNRRDFIGSAAAVAALTTLPKAALASTHNERVTISQGAVLSPYLQLALDWIDFHIREQVIYCQDNMFGTTIKLVDPRFLITSGKPIWNWMTGYTNENGLAIFIEEGGIPLGYTSMGTNIGYEEYWGRPPKRPLPDYYIRALWIDEDKHSFLSQYLPKGHLGIDMRWAGP